MFKNYFVIAVRNLFKHKSFSVINIAGMALGTACSLLILLWVQDEREKDAFHKNDRRLFRVYERMVNNGAVSAGYETRGIMADELKRNIPEIEKASPFAWQESHTFAVGNKILKQIGNSAGADFFEMFSYPLLEGSAKDALGSPESIVLSKNMAVRFFGSPAAAIGKTIRYENRKDLTVKAVFENLSPQVSNRFDFLLNWHLFQEEKAWTKLWTTTGPRALLLLRADADPAKVEQKMARFIDQYYKKQDARIYNELGIQRFSEAYLHSHFENGRPGGGRIEYVHLFSLVASFLLLIACINFMNLTTARSVQRAKEIGVRKVMGARRVLLIRQFIGEALFIAFLATLLALLLVALALPSFNQLTGKEIALPYGRWPFWAWVAALCLMTGVFSGSYPAFHLSAFNPIRVLKGSIVKARGAALWFRKGLVVFQFVLSIVLIISTLLISRQVNYIQSANLGYDKSNLFYIPIEGDLSSKLELLISEAEKSQGVASVTPLSQEPTQIQNGEAALDWEGKDPEDNTYFTHLGVGYEFASTMKIAMVEGRDFSKTFPTDSTGYILNETAARLVGYRQAIGRPFTFRGKRGTIVGVVHDFHFLSLHQPIGPLVLRLGYGERNFFSLLVRTKPGQIKEALANMQKLCKTLNPNFPFSYKFSDEEYGQLYRSEAIIGSLSVIFAILAIFIASLGLLGLSMFTAEQRTKEIGIRKVLGASVTSLFRLLSTDFLLLVAIAFLIASPIAWWSMHEWMQQFAYKAGIPWWIFGLAGIISLAIALLTVCVQSVRAASANPVKSLRSE
ncbi:MAG: ABC transporter permease [Bacteroidetes bacterium]|nr:ABC transporter permease [Bacteroidota bacterium]